MTEEDQALYQADAPPRDVAAETALRAGWTALSVFGLAGPDPREPLTPDMDAAMRGMAAFCRREPDAPEEALYRHQAALEGHDPDAWERLSAGERAVWILFRAVLRTLDSHLSPAAAEAQAAWPEPRPVPIEDTVLEPVSGVLGLSDLGHAVARREAADG